jgi:hypothetical protein
MTLITGSNSTAVLSNGGVKAGANPTFSGNTINGLIYIEAPNKVTFSGGMHINGVIVVDNPNDATRTNAIVFSGGCFLQGPETLDPATYGALCTMIGASILVPSFTVTMSGGSTSFGGSVLAKAVSLSDGSGGSINGSLISYSTARTTFSGGSGFTFTNTGASPVPTGVRFSGYFAPVASSYLEVMP